MREVIIAGTRQKIMNTAIIRCPKCAKKVSHAFIRKAYARLGEKTIKMPDNYYVELGLKGMAKRWGKPVERLRKRYLKRKLRQGDTGN